jgi:hypothetical protein
LVEANGTCFFNVTVSLENCILSVCRVPNSKIISVELLICVLPWQQNEDDTRYDTKGNIVFTCSKGLAGVGADRPVWETICHLKAGETFGHTITKSELYKGKKITCHAPFDKCGKVEDYKLAWGHFEEVFRG